MSYSQRIFLAAGNGFAAFVWFMFAFVSPDGLMTGLAICTAALNAAIATASLVLVHKDKEAEDYSRDWWN